MDLGELIQGGESETVEFKESWNDDSLKALAAFANTQGGTLLLGIADDKEVPGWPGGGKEQEVIANRIVDGLHLHPMKLATEAHEGNPVLVVQMARAAGRTASLLAGENRAVVGRASVRLWAGCSR